MPRWGMFKKFTSASVEDRLKAFILISGLLLAVLLSTAGALKLTMSPQFCARCHVMNPEYTTWQASSHLNVACTDCHIKPGLGNLVVHKISAVKELVLYATGLYHRPIKMSHKLDDVVCTQCHSSNREFTPAGDLIIPHQKHAVKKVLCVECHSGVAHGNILARKLTVDGNYAVWSAEYAREQMARDYTEPKMNTCLECHIKRNVTQACEACHSEISKPPDHKADTFLSTHGKLAKGNLDYCNKCHSYSVEARDVPNQDPAARYARGNVFCYNCHQQRPAGHTDDWRIIHKKDAAGGDISGCLVCHNSAKPGPQDKAVPTYCGKCHGGAQGGSSTGGKGEAPAKNGSGSSTGGVQQPPGKAGVGKVHEDGWRRIHPSVVKEKGVRNEGCWSCHDTTHCSRCHLNKL